MGIRLIVEIFDHWQDAGLTAGERNDLLVLAENANDGTRLTWGPVHAPYILKRANKTPEGWKNSIGKLLRKKVLTTHVPGRIKQVAVYHLEPLCPDPPHSGYKGLCSKPEKESEPNSEEGHSSGDPLEDGQEEGHLTGDPMGNPTGDPLAQEGHLTGAERVTGEVTPTPLFSSSLSSPLETPSSYLAEVVEDATLTSGEGADGGGGGVSESRSLAEQIVAALDYRGQTPGRRQQQTLTDLLAAALDAGWTIDALADYLRIKGAVDSAYAVYAYRLKPDIIPDPPQPSVAQPATQAPPPVCDTCMTRNPAARTNMRFRFRVIDGQNQACPDCHPSAVPASGGADDLFAPRPFAGDTADGGMWERAAARAAARTEQLTGTDARVAGWLALSQRLAAEELSTADHRVIQGQALAAKFRAEEKKPSGIGRNYSNDIWSQPADPAEAAKIPHCGSPNCDPVTRLKTEPDWTGEDHTSVCGDCHPALKI